MKSDDVPVLVCLTHADSLYLECVAKEEEYNMSSVELKKQAISSELTVGQHACRHVRVHAGASKRV